MFAESNQKGESRISLNCLTVWTNWKPSFLLVDHCQQSTVGSTGSADLRSSGVKVLMDHFWFSLRHPSARPKMVHPDTQQPRHHEDRTSQLQCEHVDNQLMDQSTNSSSLHSPLLHRFWDSLIKLNRQLTLALNSSPGCSHVVCLHPKQTFSVTATLLITKMTKRENSSLLPGLKRLIRPARPKVCLISLPPPRLLGISLTN